MLHQVLTVQQKLPRARSSSGTLGRRLGQGISETISTPIHGREASPVRTIQRADRRDASMCWDPRERVVLDKRPEGVVEVVRDERPQAGQGSARISGSNHPLLRCDQQRAAIRHSTRHDRTQRRHHVQGPGLRARRGPDPMRRVTHAKTSQRPRGIHRYQTKAEGGDTRVSRTRSPVSETSTTLVVTLLTTSWLVTVSTWME